MTTTVKVHVNGNYRATVVQDGKLVVVNPQEEKTLPHQPGKTNVYTVTEEYLGEKPQPQN